jgi:hypothetical protein
VHAAGSKIVEAGQALLSLVVALLKKSLEFNHLQQSSTVDDILQPSIRVNASLVIIFHSGRFSIRSFE